MNGTQTTVDRRERPFVYLESGVPRCLFTAVQVADATWITAQPLA